MSQYPVFDRMQIQLAHLSARQSDVTIDQLARLEIIDEAWQSLELLRLSSQIRAARAGRRPTVVMIGGHPIKLGLSQFLIDLIEKGFITCLATEGTKGVRNEWHCRVTW